MPQLISVEHVALGPPRKLDRLQQIVPNTPPRLSGIDLSPPVWFVESWGFSFPPFPSPSRWAKSIKHGRTGSANQRDEVYEEMGKCFGMQVQIITGINNVRQLLQCSYWIIENARVLWETTRSVLKAALDRQSRRPWTKVSMKLCSTFPLKSSTVRVITHSPPKQRSDWFPTHWRGHQQEIKVLSKRTFRLPDDKEDTGVMLEEMQLWKTLNGSALVKT